MAVRIGGTIGSMPPEKRRGGGITECIELFYNCFRRPDAFGIFIGAAFEGQYDKGLLAT